VSLKYDVTQNIFEKESISVEGYTCVKRCLGNRSIMTQFRKNIV